MTKQNLVKRAGNLNNVGHMAMSNKNYSRQTVYYNNRMFPILMTPNGNFYVYNNSMNGGKNKNPAVSQYMVNGNLRNLAYNTPLPRNLTNNNFNPNINYNNDNNKNLYSRKRTESVANYKKRINKRKNNNTQARNIRSKIHSGNKITESNANFLRKYAKNARKNNPNANNSFMNYINRNVKLAYNSLVR